jgi:hypothetical protein
MSNTKPATSWLGRQAVTLFGPAIDAVRQRRWGRLWLGPAAAVMVAGLALAFRTPSGHAFLVTYAITQPGDALSTMLVKLPLSMFAPAALLPFWFALFQVAIVYTFAQTQVGTVQTIIVAVSGHTLATLSAHLWILVGRPFGVGHGYDHFGDAGPSVAVVALLAYVAVARRFSWLAIAILAYDATELSIFNGLSQREHLVGALTGFALGAITRLLARHKGPGPDTTPVARGGSARPARPTAGPPTGQPARCRTPGP